MNQDILLIARALDFAARKHVNQRRKGLAEEPYFNHLAEVARLLAEATDGEDANLVAAGLLHDSIEDQGVLHEDLVSAFNQDIADLLCLRRKTVETHRSNIMDKLDMHKVTDLVKYAIREGLVGLE